MKVRFEFVGSGWMKMAIAGSSGVYFETVCSNVPNDCLRELVEALVVVADGTGLSTALCSQEPGYHAVSFVNAPDHQMELSVGFRWDTGLRDSETLLEVEDSRDKIIRSFWRGLRLLESQDDAKTRESWASGFPSREFALLTEKLKQRVELN